jgi:hypothetical protein
VEVGAFFAPTAVEGPAVCLCMVRSLNQIDAGQKSTEGEATDSVAFVPAIIYFLRFQPRKRMSSPKTT